MVYYSVELLDERSPVLNRCKVEKVGTKYLYLKRYPDTRFIKATLKQDEKEGRIKLFNSMPEAVQEQDRIKMLSYIFNNLDVLEKLDFANVRNIAYIINNKNKTLVYEKASN